MDRTAKDRAKDRATDRVEARASVSPSQERTQPTSQELARRHLALSLMTLRIRLGMEAVAVASRKPLPCAWCFHDWGMAMPAQLSSGMCSYHFLRLSAQLVARHEQRELARLAGPGTGKSDWEERGDRTLEVQP